MLLSRGDLDNGWAEYQWRLSMNHGLPIMAKDRFREPLWLGEEPLDGKTILLHAEQGLGGTLQFCRFSTPVAALGAQVILEVQQPLSQLLADLPGVSQLVMRGEDLRSFDYHCPLLSLPLAFNTTLDDIPHQARYLRGDPGKVNGWLGKLSNIKMPRVGLV